VVQFARNFARSGQATARILNLGCGDNPLFGAVNVDIKVLQEVDVAADAYHLPFKDAVFGQIVVQNPYRWQPLTSDAARVLISGGTLIVVGHLWNPFIARMREIEPSQLRGLGWEFIDESPASEALKFGTPRSTTGQRLDTRTFIQITYRRL
jgi:SAM-dependent methyltransferase